MSEFRLYLLDMGVLHRQMADLTALNLETKEQFEVEVLKRFKRYPPIERKGCSFIIVEDSGLYVKPQKIREILVWNGKTFDITKV